MKPTIILSLGRPRLLPVGAIAIDLKHNCFWRGVRRRPKFNTTGRIGYQAASFRIIAILMIRSPAIVSHREMMDYLWAEDPNGGPDNPQNYISKRIDIARNGDPRENRETILQWLGAKVIATWCQGYRLEFTGNQQQRSPQ